MATEPRTIQSLNAPRRAQPGSYDVSEYQTLAPTEVPTETVDRKVETSANKRNDALDPEGNLTPFERNQIFTRAAAGSEEDLIRLAKAGIIEKPAGESTPNTMLALARAGLDLAAQYLPQGSDANRIATGTRGLLNNLGLPGAEADPRVEDYTNQATRGVNTVKNILGGF